MKKSPEKLFNQFIDDVRSILSKWHNAKPAQRTAFLLFCDREAKEWHVSIAGNKRSKHSTGTALEGLVPAMREHDELFGYIRACVECVEREKKKALKAAKKEA